MFDTLGQQISNVIWNTMLQWFYETIYGAVADFFTMMGSMGADIFDLDWVKATIKLFTLFGWSLFIAGVVVAVFDVAIEYQCGRANVKTTAINILKGFFACSLIGIVPVELYKFCISLQNTFSHDLSRIFAGTQSLDLAGQSTSVLQGIRETERERSYEYGLPAYLQHDLDAYKDGLKNKSSILDCLWGELYGSINMAQITDGVITPEHADYLRQKYL